MKRTRLFYQQKLNVRVALQVALRLNTNEALEAPGKSRSRGQTPHTDDRRQQTPHTARPHRTPSRGLSKYIETKPQTTCPYLIEHPQKIKNVWN